MELSPGHPAVRSAAFFDVDGTLIQGDTQYMEAKSLLENNRRPGYLTALLMALAAFRLNHMGFISVARQNAVYLRTYQGMDKNMLGTHGAALFRDQMHRRLYPEMLDVLEKHRVAGRMIVLISATTCHLLAPFQEMLRPHAAFCTHLDFDGRNRCTGRPLEGICAEERKAKLMRHFAREHGLNLGHSYAYADHPSDIPMLSVVGHPVAVNPGPVLAAHARQAGWEQMRVAL